MSALDEASLVGALLWLPIEDVRAARELFDVDDLDDPRHRIIVCLVDHCVASGVTPDPAAVFAAARSTGQVEGHKLGQLGGVLQARYGEVAHPRWFEVYANGVVEASVRRKLRATGERLMQVADAADVVSVAAVVGSEAQALATCAARICGQVSDD